MNQWLAKIKAGNGQLEIDLDDDILPIFQQFMMHVTLGANIENLSVNCYKRARGKPGVFELKNVSVSEAVEETF